MKLFMKEKITKLNRKCSENTTKYGEFVCSEFQWLPIEKQKRRAEKFENMTQKDNQKNK